MKKVELEKIRARRAKAPGIYSTCCVYDDDDADMLAHAHEDIQALLDCIDELVNRDYSPRDVLDMD